MSILDKLNQWIKPFRSLMLNGSMRSLFSQDFAVVSLTAQQTGERLTIPADFIRSGAVVYLFIDYKDERWKTLVKGVPVKIQIESVDYHGWAEELTGYREFLQVLSENPLKRSELAGQYVIFKEASMDTGSTQFKQFLDEYKLIRVKISR